MSHLDAKQPATTRELRSFGLLVGGALLVIAGVAFWRNRPAAVFGTLASVGTVLALTGLLAPALLARVHRAWMAFAVALSKVTTPILMGVIYFVLLTPLGVAKRLMTGRALGASATKGSLWIERNAGERQSDLQRQF